MHLCPKCDRPFSRHSNMVRHLQNVHHKYKPEEDEEENVIEDETDSESDGENSDDVESNHEKDSVDDSTSDEEEEEEEESDHDNDSEDEEKDDAETYDLWNYLKAAARKNASLAAKFEEMKQRLDNGDLTDEELSEEARRLLKPDVLKHISAHYANFLKIWHFAKENKYHRQIMKTKRKLIDEEEFSPVEAIEQAVKKRKYLIVKATDLLEDDLAEEVPAPALTDEEVEEEEEEED